MAYDDDMFVPPWREWSNDFINAEKWDEFRDKKVFHHPGGHERLPIEIARNVKEWKRPDEIFGIDELVIQPKEDKNDILSLLVTNEPFMNVKVYRWILHHLVLYTTQFQNDQWPQPWRPSNLIFSKCRAEISWNKKSKPEYNSFGKYWIKLYYMGKFRMVCVSDHLPVSDNNRVLLPLCENPKELWLPLLVKALLRIYTSIGESDSFNTITCITGWSCIRQNCQHISKEDLWSSILYHTENPVVDDEYTKNKIENPKPSKINKIKRYPISTFKHTQDYRDKIISNNEVNSPNSIVIAITLSSTNCKNKQDDSLNSQPIFLNQVKIAKIKSLETWKKYRWTQWAVKNNIIKKHEINNFMKSVNIHAPCTILAKQSSPLMKVLSEYQTVENKMQYELDFSYLEPFVTYIEFYIKSSQAFPFVKPVLFQNNKNNGGHNNYYASTHSTSTEHAHNCCVCLHFESSYCESMLFTLSVCEDHIIRDGNVSVLDVSRNTIDAFVCVESFHWYEGKLQTPLSSMFIRTRGMCNDLVKFEPGINALRVWGVLPTNYSLMVESTVDFSVHQTSQTVYRILTDQPILLTSMIAPIKQSFLQLCAAEPNTGDYEQKLRKFYSSFMPQCTEQESEMKKIERFSIISKQVHTAVLKCIEYQFSNDLYTMNDLTGMIELYKELQEVFQNDLLGKKQISDLNKQIKSFQLKEVHIKPVQMNKKKSQDERFSTAKSTNAKAKSNNSKNSFVLSNKASKSSVVLQFLNDFMFEILCDVLSSENINIDEYYFKNDLLNYMNSINYDEKSTKQIDQLLLFRFDINTHSTTELAPTVILLSVKSCNNRTANLTLIDNDSEMEVKPINTDMTLFMVKRTTKGYTLLGWLWEKLPDEKLCNYKLSFYGRPYEMLHSCGTQKNNYFYKYSRFVCDNMSTPDIVTKRVNNTLYKPNAANLLTRAFLKIENAAQFTVYFHSEYLINTAVELRVTDKNNSSMVFASTYTKRKMAIIPSVFLDPNYNNTQPNASNEAEDTKNSMLFAIEVILIKHIETDHTDESKNYDGTISCTYDQKLTDITLDSDTSSNYFKFVTSIPHQMNTQKSPLPVNVQKPNVIRSTETPNSNTTTNTDKTNILQANYNFQQIVESMIIKNVKTSKNKLLTNDALELTTADDTIESSTPLFKEENPMYEIFERQNSIFNAIKTYFDDIKTESRQNYVNQTYMKVISLIEIQPKTNINAKQSRMMKKRLSSYT